MRDPTRIDRLLTEIKETWRKFPDWRLGQLLVNAVQPNDPSPEIYSIEDSNLEKLVSRLREGKAMTRHAFNVADTYEISGRGLVVLADKTYSELPTWLALKPNDPVEIRTDVTPIIRTFAVGIEMSHPWTPENQFGFLLPSEISKSQVPVGCAVWVTEKSVIN